MKKLTIIFLMLFLGSMTNPTFAIEYCMDLLEQGNPGGSSISEKTFDTLDEGFMVTQGQQYEVDIWICEVAGSANAGGFWLTYDPSITIVSVGAYVMNTPDPPDLSGPWGNGETNKVPNPDGPGTYMLTVANLGGAAPDGDFDIIIAKVTFNATASGNATIIARTIPGVATWTPYDDASILPQWDDSDGDTVVDYVDNCLETPNGSGGGTCTA